MKFTLAVSLLLSPIFTVVAAGRIHEVNRRQHNHVQAQNTTLEARGPNSKWTFYNTETGNA